MKIRDILFEIQNLPFSNNEYRKITSLALKGLHDNDIAAQLSINPSRVKKFIKNKLDKKTQTDIKNARIKAGSFIHKPYTQGEIKSIKSLAFRGLSYTDISKKLGMTLDRVKDCVRYYFSNADKERRKAAVKSIGGYAPQEISNDEYQEILSKMIQGLSNDDIATSHNRSKGTIKWIYNKLSADKKDLIRNARKLKGQKTRTPSIPLTSDEISQIEQWYSQGLNPTIIANKLNPVRLRDQITGYLRKLKKIDRKKFDGLRDQYLKAGGTLQIPWTQDEINFIRKEYADGRLITSISKMLDPPRNPSSVHRKLSTQKDNIDLRNQHIENRQQIVGTSQEEIDFFNQLSAVGIKFTNRNYRVSIGGKRFYNLDAIDTNSNVVVEYFGDLFHCNPNIAPYNSIASDQPFSTKLGDLTPQEIWDHDKQKIDFLQSQGYKVIVVWGSDWKNKANQPAIIDKIKKTMSAVK